MRPSPGSISESTGGRSILPIICANKHPVSGDGDLAVELDMEQQDPDDNTKLQQMGYKPELIRSMSKISMLGLAFSVLSCWGEIGSSLTSGLSAGGPATLIWGWVGVCVFTLAVVMSLGEICSAYPANSGQYYWVAILAGNRWGRSLSYITAIGQMAGLIGIGAAAAANVSESTYGMAALVNPDFVESPYKTVLVCWGIIVLCCWFNIYGRKCLNALGWASLIWGIAGLVITVIVILSCTDTFQSGTFVLTSYANQTGLSDRYKAVVVCLGITNLSYVMCCYDAPCHMAEEMQNAQEDCPKAMVWSVYLGSITGLIYLLSIMFCISDVDAVEDSDNPIFPIYYQATQSLAASCCLGFILLITQVLAEASFIAETSRSIMAFGRDRGLPFSDWFAYVHPTLGVPVNAVIVTGSCQAAIMAIYFGSSTAFLTILAIGTIGLYFSYAMPIAAMLYARTQGTFVGGPYRLSKPLALLCNIAGLAFLVFEIAWFFVPTRFPITGGNMNYSSAAAGVVALIGTIFWHTGARSEYTVTGNLARAEALANTKEHRTDQAHLVERIASIGGLSRLSGDHSNESIAK